MSCRGDCSSEGASCTCRRTMVVWSATMVTRAAMEGTREGTATGESACVVVSLWLLHVGGRVARGWR